MTLQEEVGQLVIGNDLIPILIIAEHIGNNIPDLVLILLHDCLQNVDNFVFLKLLIIIGIILRQNVENLLPDSIGQGVGGKCKGTFHRDRHYSLLLVEFHFFYGLLEVESFRKGFVGGDLLRAAAAGGRGELQRLKRL